MSSTEVLPPEAAEPPASNPEPLQSPAAAPAAKLADLAPSACAARLKELFPALFTGAPKPLKLRVQVDIQQRAPGVFTKATLSAFFRRYTGSTSYLLAVAKGRERFDLDGQPSGEITDEHRQVAADELARRRANEEARRAHEDQQRNEQRRLEEQQRRNRAGLLHDYERTTLTRANFCVLKGVAEAELDGLLAIAREESARDRPPEHRTPAQRLTPAAKTEAGRRPHGPPRHERRG